MRDRVSHRNRISSTMTVRNLPGPRLILFVSLIALLGFQVPASADIVYATTLGNNSIVQVNTSTNSVTPFASASSPDSMIFLNSNTALYTNYFGGQLESLNLTTKVSTPLVSGLNRPVDLVLDPGGNTLLVTEQAGFKIDRVNLSTNILTLFANTGFGSYPGGLAYIGANLYAITNSASGTISQLNPTTGAVIKSASGLGGLDGLTYDSFTGLLYATDETGNRVLAINPSTLSASVLVRGIPTPDGIASDGHGNLFIAALNRNLDQYNLVTNTLTVGAGVPGIDDPAPLSGLESARAGTEQSHHPARPRCLRVDGLWVAVPSQAMVGQRSVSWWNECTLISANAFVKVGGWERSQPREGGSGGRRFESSRPELRFTRAPSANCEGTSLLEFPGLLTNRVQFKYAMM